MMASRKTTLLSQRNVEAIVQLTQSPPEQDLIQWLGPDSETNRGLERFCK